MSGYPLLNAFWTMFLFFIWVLWIWLVIWVLMDIFRSRDISGWGKAGWIVLVIFLPLIGVLAYEIVHSDHLFGRRDAYDAYPDVPSQGRSRGASSASDLSQLSDLHDRGVISDAEFERGKQKILQYAEVAMSLPAGERRKLRVIERAEARDDPGLAARYHIFNRLTRHEDMPRTERLRKRTIRRKSRAERAIVAYFIAGRDPLLGAA